MTFRLTEKKREATLLSTRGEEDGSNTRYIKTNNPVSAYALHILILNNRHEYGNAEQTTELVKPCKKKRNKMNCWESFFIHILQKQNVLINEQRVKNLTLSTNCTRHYIT
jgi:hypothetical protein